MLYLVVGVVLFVILGARVFLACALNALYGGALAVLVFVVFSVFKWINF